MADRSVVYRLIAETSQFKREMAAAGQATDGLGDKTQKNTGKAAAGLEMLSGAATGAAAAYGVKTLMAAANFEQGMSNVQAATMATEEDLAKLEEAALSAGESTKFSATEAAAGIENLAKAGVSTADILDGGLMGSLDLAAAGSMDVATASEIAATALTQFKLAGEDIPHVADLLAAGAGKAQGDVTDLAGALKQSGLVAAQMNVSIEETTGTLAAFASAGLIGSDAGTSFRTMLLRLSNPTKESAELMEELGIQAYDANGQFVGMASIAGQLQTAFEGKTQAERDSAMATLFGSDAIRAANVLYSEGQSGIQGWTAAVDDTGYAAEQAAIKMDNLKGRWEEFTGALETTMIGQGDDYLGPFGALLDGGTQLLNLFNELQNATDGWVGTIIGGPISMLARGFNEGKEALFGTKGAAEETTDATKELSAATSDAQGSFDVAAEAAENFTDAIKELQGELADDANARSYQAALDEFTAAVKENGLALTDNGKKFDITTDKGRKVEAAFQNIASEALNAADGLSQADAQKTLRTAMQDIRTFAKNMGLPKSEVSRLIGLLREADRANANPQVNVGGVGAAIGQVQSLAAQVRAVDGMSATAYVNVVRRGQRTGVNPLDPYGSADGSTVPKDGGPYADRYLYLLAPGEEVISNRNGQADKWRPLLKAINGGLADGGTAGPSLVLNRDEQRQILDLRKEIRDLVRDLNKDGKERLKGIERVIAKRELADARRQVREVKSGPELRAYQRQLEQEKSAAEKLAESANLLAEGAKNTMDAAAQIRDAAQAQYDAVKGSVVGNMTADLFGGGSLSSFDKAIRRQDRDNAAFEQTMQALIGAGLDGALLEEVASKGNLKFAQQLLGAGAGGIAEYERLYASGLASADRTGALVADTTRGEELRAAQQGWATAAAQFDAMREAAERAEVQLALIEAAVDRAAERTGISVGQEINGTTATAVRTATARGPRGKKGRNR